MRQLALYLMTQHDNLYKDVKRRFALLSRGIQMSTGTTASLLKHKENIVLVIYIRGNPSRMLNRGIVF